MFCHYFMKKIILLIYLFSAVLHLCCRMRTFSGCGKQGLRSRCGGKAPGPAGSQAPKPLMHMRKCGASPASRTWLWKETVGLRRRRSPCRETGRRQTSGPAGPRGELHTLWGAALPEAVGGCPGDAGPRSKSFSVTSAPPKTSVCSLHTQRHSKGR